MKALNNVFYILMSVMAMNFLAILSYIVLMLQFDTFSTGDLYDVVQVLVGNQKYSLSKDQISEYNQLKKDHDEMLRQLNEAEGSDKTRADSAIALMDVKKELEEKNRALKDLRAENENTLASLREQIETAKKDLQKEREKLADWRKETTKSELSARFQQMKKTLLAMDAEQIAIYLAQVNASNGAPEAARIIRTYLPPELSAEVLMAMPERDTRKILPLIENQYADIAMPALAKRWTTPGTDDYKTPEQIAQYMRRMTTSQAFTLFTLFDPKIRAILVQYLVTPDTNEKNP